MLHDENKINSRKGYIAAVFFSVLIGFSFLAIKICQKYVGSINVLCYRYDFAFAVSLVLVAAGIFKIRINGRPKSKLMFAASFYVGSMALQVVGLMFATSIEGAVIFAAVPILVKIAAAVFLKEKSTWRENGFICLTVAALMVMIIMGAADVSIDPVGAFLLVISSIAMAFSNVFTRSARHDYKPSEITMTIVVMGFVVFNLIMMIMSFAGGSGAGDYFEPLGRPSVFAAGAYLGIGCILLSSYLMNYMLSKMKAAKAAVFGNVSTAISIIAGIFILGETLMWYHIVCTILIIAGVVGLNTGRERKEQGN